MQKQIFLPAFVYTIHLLARKEPMKYDLYTSVKLLCELLDVNRSVCEE